MGTVGALLGLWLMAAGVTQPGGPGTNLYIYDNASAANGLYYTPAEISAAFPADFVDLGTFRKSYRSLVTVQIGDTTADSAATTLQATNADIYFDNLKTLQFRTTQTSSWSLILGEKIGTGNVAGAKNGCTLAFGTTHIMRGLVKLYDSELISVGNSNITSALGADDNGSEIVGCTFLAMGLGNVSLGTATQRFSNIYNVNIFGAGILSVTNWGAVNADNIKVANATPTAFFRTNAANIKIKNALFTGAPTTSDWSWTNVAATNWVLVRPTYSNLAPKFSQAAVGSMAVDNGAKEVWIYNVKVSGATGSAISGIPVKLTDVLGNVVVDTTTDANGRIAFTTTFPSGATEANGVIVMDHYTVSQVYTQRHRSPFLVEVNTGASRNTSYSSYRYYKYWPGYETITTSAGTFEDVNDIIPLEFAAGPGGTTWVEHVTS